MTYPNNSNQFLPGTVQIPSALEITAITNSYPMVITVLVDLTIARNTYISGQLLRLNIPHDYGMSQANGLVAKVISNIGNNITVDVDSSSFDIFAVPVGGEQPASVAPAGSRNLIYGNSTNQVPFQSLNSQGN